MLNLLLIPRWAAVGAILASILAEGTITVLYVRNCRGFLSTRTLWDCARWRAPVGAAMCLLVMALGRLPLESGILKLVIQVLSGAAFYVAALYLLKDAMTRELLSLIPKTLKKLLNL